MNKKFAFSLSEVLVTMSIIGVISALTVPTLINSYQRKAYSVQLRKTVNDIVNAVDMLITEEGKSKFSATTEYANLDTFVTNRLKTIKTCASTETSACFANTAYGTIGGGNSAAFACAGNSYVLASSAAICLTKDGSAVKVNVDINGNEGPNIGGRDMFELYITADGEAADCPSGNCEDPSTATCPSSALGTDCYGVLSEANWQMNY